MLLYLLWEFQFLIYCFQVRIFNNKMQPVDSSLICNATVHYLIQVLHPAFFSINSSFRNEVTRAQ